MMRAAVLLCPAGYFSAACEKGGCDDQKKILNDNKLISDSLPAERGMNYAP